MNHSGYLSLKTLVATRKKFAIIAHKNPDGDTLGSCLAFFHFLRSEGKEVDLICFNEAPESLLFLPGIEQLKNSFRPSIYEYLIFCDSAAPHLTGFDRQYPELFDGTMTNIVNIDHHFSSQAFGEIKIIDDRASATANIILDLFEYNGWRISPDIATCLYTGIMTDTGSFMHSNTDADTLRKAGKLLAKGADLPKITKHIFQTKKISTLRLWGKVFSHLSLDADRRVVLSGITKEDIKASGADYSELTGVIDYLNSVHDADFALLLAEQDKVVKGSLRTMQEEVDVAEIASKLGGGGHKKAAGFGIDGRLEQYTGWRVVEERREEKIKVGEEA